MKPNRINILLVILSTLLFIGCTIVYPVSNLDSEISDNEYLKELTKSGIVKGDSKGLRLSDKISRGEITSLVIRMLGKEDEIQDWEEKIFYSDILSDSRQSWANGYINLASRLKLIDGYPDYTFKPGKDVLQSEAVAILVRTLKDIDKAEGADWADEYIKIADSLNLLENIENFEPNKSATREMVFILVYNTLKLDQFKDIELNQLGYLDEDLALNNNKRPTLGPEDIKDTISTDEFILSDDIDSVITIVGKIGDCLYFKEDGTTLSRSLDIDIEPEKLYVFDDNIDSVHITDSDIIYVTTSKDRWSKDNNAVVYRSEDFGISFDPVLEIPHGTVFYVGVDSFLDKVFISEYGIKTKGYNARNIYRSLDNGENFELIYSPVSEEGYHNHVVHIDRYNPSIIYQVIGDDNKRLLISTDNGENFETLWWGNYHPMAVVDRGDYLLFGLDNAPYSGLVKYDKTQKKLIDLPELKVGPGPMYNMIEYRDKVYFGTISYEGQHDFGSGFFETEDGEDIKTLFEIHKDSKDSPTYIGNIVPKGEYLYIEVYFDYIDNGKQNSYRGTMKYKIGS